MIPVVVRSTEEMLKIVPNELREAAYALGVPKWRTIIKVVLPHRRSPASPPGSRSAIARVIGETAPLLVTVGITTGVNFNPFSGRMATLPVFAYYSYAAPGVPREPFIDRAWTAALVLIIIVMALNLAGAARRPRVRAQDRAEGTTTLMSKSDRGQEPQHLLRLVPRRRGRHHVDPGRRRSRR